MLFCENLTERAAMLRGKPDSAMQARRPYRAGIDPKSGPPGSVTQKSHSLTATPCTGSGQAREWPVARHPMAARTETEAAVAGSIPVCRPHIYQAERPDCRPSAATARGIGQVNCNGPRLLASQFRPA
jgi:hypothetical protein